MKICVFAYNFEHKKTYEGLCKLKINNIKISKIFAANKVSLNIKESRIRVGIDDLIYDHSKKIANNLNIPYVVIKHDSKKLEYILKKEKYDLGIILGSRIIKKNIINQFKIGILNMHPGILPKNRGLDTHKWAIINNIKQGVTCHLINEKVDLGKMICKKNINIFKHDTLVDINYRLQNLELKLMIDSIKILKKKIKFSNIKNLKNLHSTLNQKSELKMIKNFESYKKNYKKIKS
jgi:folate-dependent phosphoribosylglycinamide formyltransferase PurN